MTLQEKLLARTMFKNKILSAEGQAFEDIFTSIMNYADDDFRSIKPWGNIGDRKNDGYIENKGIFFQVFAPEDINRSYPGIINKLNTDFDGLVKHWNSIREFYFVVNDKYKGVKADSEKEIKALKINYDLDQSGFKTAKDLENLLFTLNDDEILMVTGNIPDPAAVKHIDYSVIKEVIDHIMRLPIPSGLKPKIILPDWDEKIVFNKLSEPVASLLNNGYFQIHSFENYLSKNGDFLADTLRNKMNDIYMYEKVKNRGDNLFWAVVNSASPASEQRYQTAAIVIMSKYFESCDIFEEPLAVKK